MTDRTLLTNPFASRLRNMTPLGAAAWLLGGLALASPASAQPKTGLSLSLETYVDDATQRFERTTGGLENDTEETEVGRGLISGAVAVTFMAPVTDAVRVGGGVRYLSNYRYEADDAEEDDDPTLIGRLFELYGRGEYFIALSGPLSLVPAVELGVPVLFPSGDLQGQLDYYEGLGYDVNGLPRIGFLIGAEFGAHYQLEEWLALRAGLGLLHERMILIDADITTSTGGAEVDRNLSIMRVRLAAGVEANF